jgi:hypothetical protein
MMNDEQLKRTLEQMNQAADRAQSNNEAIIKIQAETSFVSKFSTGLLLLALPFLVGFGIYVESKIMDFHGRILVLESKSHSEN